MEIRDFPTPTPRIEWPTIALAAIIYAMWFVVTFFWAHIPFWALTLVGAWTTAWHMSLQHEIIHGHPTLSEAVMEAGRAADGWLIHG